MNIDERAREKYVEYHETALRLSLSDDLSSFDEKVIKVIADMYRRGWDDCAGWMRAQAGDE